MSGKANIDFIKKMNHHLAMRVLTGDYKYDADLKTLKTFYEGAVQVDDAGALSLVALTMGILHYVAGYPTKSIRAYELAIKHCQDPTNNNPYSEVAAIINKAEVYQALGDFQQMLAVSDAAQTCLETIAEDSRHGAQFNIWSVRAYALLNMGRYAEARTTAMRVTEATPPTQAFAQQNYINSILSVRRTLAELNLIENDLTAAMVQAKLLIEYEAIQTSVIDATVAYLVMAHVAEKMDKTEHPAQYYYDVARANAEKIPNVGKRGYIFLEEARYSLKHGNTARATRLALEVKAWFEEAASAEGVALADKVLTT